MVSGSTKHETQSAEDPRSIVLTCERWSRYSVADGIFDRDRSKMEDETNGSENEWTPEMLAWLNAEREAREAVKNKHRELFQKLRDCLFEHDPILINFGFNHDEYDSEAATIIPRLAGCKSQSDVLDVVHEEFVKWFGDDIAGPKSKYDKVSQDVWMIWNETQAQA
jgi:hypothetical protein